MAASVGAIFRELPKEQGLYRVSADENSLSVVVSSSSPLLNLADGEKGRFQKIHNGQELDEALLGKLVESGIADGVEDITGNVFTIGIGTNLILRDASGSLEIPMVQRTQTGHDGTPNLGKISRAAGGSTADMAASGAREFYEECFCVANVGGQAKLLRFVFQDSALPEAKAATFRDAHVNHARDVVRVHQTLLDTHGFALSPDHVAKNVVDVPASILSVKGLTTAVTQTLDGAEKILQDRFITAPVGGDYNLDIILAAQLPEGVTFDRIIFIDGETDAKTGQILNEKNSTDDQRSWALSSPKSWDKALKRGLKISQGPAQLYDHLDEVLVAAHEHFEP